MADRRTWALSLGLTAFVLGSVGGVAVAAALILAGGTVLLAAPEVEGAVAQAPEPVVRAQPRPVLRTAPTAVPRESEPPKSTPTSAPASRRAVAPAPAPVPAPSAPPPPPSPEPVEPAEPAESEEAPALGVVILTGDEPIDFWLERPGERSGIDEVPPGRWFMLGRFDGGPEVDLGEVQVLAGRTVTVKCSSVLRRCKAQTP